MYGIKLQSCNRYILWCDNHWFETVEGECLPFSSKQEAMDAIKRLVNYYMPHVTLVSEKERVDYDFGKKRVKPVAPKAVTVTTTIAVGDFSLF